MWFRNVSTNSLALFLWEDRLYFYSWVWVCLCDFNQQNAAKWWCGTSKAGLGTRASICSLSLGVLALGNSPPRPCSLSLGMLALETVPEAMRKPSSPSPSGGPSWESASTSLPQARGNSRWPSANLWSPHWTLPKALISEQSESCWCFRPLRFEVFCLSVIANWNCSQVFLFPFVQKVQLFRNHRTFPITTPSPFFHNIYPQFAITVFICPFLNFFALLLELEASWIFWSCFCIPSPSSAPGMCWAL